MKLFGISIWTLAIVLIAFYVGAKNPGLLAKVPILNRV